MALSAYGNRGRYGVEQEVEERKDVPEGIKYDAALRRAASESSSSETEKLARELSQSLGISMEEARREARKLTSGSKSESEEPPWHAVHLDSEPRRRIEPAKPPEELVKVVEGVSGTKWEDLPPHIRRNLMKEYESAVKSGAREVKIVGSIVKFSSPSPAERYYKEAEFERTLNKVSVQKEEVRPAPMVRRTLTAEELGVLKPEELTVHKESPTHTRRTLTKEEMEPKTTAELIQEMYEKGEKIEHPVLAAAKGFEVGLVSTAFLTPAALTEVAINRGPNEAGRQLVEGTVEWAKSLPGRIASGRPFEVGAVLGELAGGYLAGEALGRPIGRVGRAAVGEAMWQGLKAKAYLTVKVAEPLRMRAEVARLSLEDIRWKLTEPLYQKGILKPRKIEIATEKPLRELLREARKTYENIRLGISNLKGEIRPLSRAQIREIEARNFGTMSEKPLNYAELVYLQHLGELLGVKEEIKAERAQWIKNSEIVDISETGEWVTVETIYKGKRGRGYKVTWELSDTKVPEELWKKYEEWSFVSEPKVLRSRTEPFRLEPFEPFERPKDLSTELKRRWEAREREYRKLEQQGRAARSGRQTLLLKEEARMAKEIVRIEELEKLAREIKARNQELVKSGEISFPFVQKHVYTRRSYFEQQHFAIMEPVSFRVLYRSIEKISGRFDQMFRYDQAETLGERYSERSKLGTETELGTETVLRQETKELERLAQKLQQKQRQLQRQAERAIVLQGGNPRQQFRQFRLGRTEKKRHGERRSGRSYKKVRHPVLRFEDILAKEVRKYAKKVRKALSGGKSKKSRRR